jgi:restriction endonuclease Mrr
VIFAPVGRMRIDGFACAFAGHTARSGTNCCTSSHSDGTTDRTNGRTAECAPTGSHTRPDLMLFGHPACCGIQRFRSPFARESARNCTDDRAGGRTDRPAHRTEGGSS